MKKFFTLIFFFTLFANLSFAQPSVLKKAGKSLLVLKSFDEAGNLIGSANGFYVGTNGEAVSCYQPLKGASRAVVIGADGKERQVECILGASEIYDVSKFRVADVESKPLPLASTTAPEGANVWMMPDKSMKKAQVGVVSKVEKFEIQYDYYTLELQMPTNAEGSPLFNEEGLVIGMMQSPITLNDHQSYAISALYIDSLEIKGLSINSPDLKAIKIKKDLPKELDQAVLTLYLAGNTQDSATYVEMIEDFIKRFPTAPDGYYYRAIQSYQRNDFLTVQKDMELAIEMTNPKDASHYNYSRIIYDKELQKSQLPFQPWSLDKALSEAKEAYAISPQPAYLHQQGMVLYAQRNYQAASDVYTELLKGPMRSPEMFHEASRCHIMMGDTIGQLALLDSAMAMFSRPLLRSAAPYLVIRAQALITAGKFRDAVLDLNEYEHLMTGQVNDQFYYLRFQAGMGGRIYQQALNDINRAIEMKPSNDLYYSEKASLLVRVGLLDEAKATAQQLITLSPNQSDGYLFLGLAMCLKGEKAEGLENLKKALEKGDPQAEGFIKRFQ